MVDFEKLFTKFMFIGLFVLALFAFIFSVQADNNAPILLSDNKLINDSFTEIQDDLTSFRTSSQTEKTLFESESPSSGFGTILLFTVVNAGKVFNGMIVGLFNVLIKLPVVFLGFPIVLVSVLSTMLIFAIIWGLWSKYKLGT